MPVVVLGVTGCIGAYKACEVLRELQRREVDVHVVMTAAATRFVTPMTFEALSRHPVFHDQWELGREGDIRHISIADDGGPPPRGAGHRQHPREVRPRASPTTRSARSTLATRAPVVVAPAMNVNMFEHPAVQENLAILRARGVGVVEPGRGYLACGWLGKGRLAEVGEIVEAAMAALAPPARARGRDGARHRGAHGRGRRPRALRLESLDRGRWATAWPRRRATGGRR